MDFLHKDDDLNFQESHRVHVFLKALGYECYGEWLFLVKVNNGRREENLPCREDSRMYKRLGHILQHRGSQRVGLLNAPGITWCSGTFQGMPAASATFSAALRKIPAAPYPTVYHSPLRWGRLVSAE